MDNIRMRIPFMLDPIDTSKNQFLSPKSSNYKADVFLINTPINYETRQECFSSSFRKNINENLRKIAGQETPTNHLRHISIFKDRDLENIFAESKSPALSHNKTTRSKRRHPKIAITRKNQDKIKPFSLHSELEENDSIFSKDFNEIVETSKQCDNCINFRSSSMMESSRLDTPGFVSKELKEASTENRTGTTETNDTNSKSISSYARPNSRLRFKRINITKRLKKLENLDIIQNLTDKKLYINKQKTIQTPSLILNPNIIKSDLNNFLNFEIKCNKVPCVCGECGNSQMNSNFRLSFAQNFEQNNNHQKSMMPTFVSIFDNSPNRNDELTHNKSVESNPYIGEKLKRLGKVINRHRRIESMANKIDHFEINNKKVIFTNGSSHISTK